MNEGLSHYDGGKQRILVIDDSLTNTQNLTEILAEEYHVFSAHDGKDGIAKALEYQVDLILLDIQMPVMDGYEVCRRLKRNEDTRDIPVIFVTALDDVDDEAKGLDLGAIDYIVKPYSLRIIQSRVRNHMELARHRKTLQALSLTDGLTSLPNRRQFDQTLIREWRRGHRQQVALSIMLIDIDHFKRFNDFYGHQKGDLCLQQFAAAINSCRTRAADFVARYGGEEFIAVLPETRHTGAVKMANRILEELRNQKIPHVCNDDHKFVTASIGVFSAVPSDQFTAEILVKKADEALYKAKSAGRNQVVALVEDALQ